MGDKYKLTALLGIREQEQLDAEEEYAREIQELARRKQLVTAKEEELAACMNGRREACSAHDSRKVRGDATMVEIQLFDIYLSGLDVDMQRMRDEKHALLEATKTQEAVVGKAKGALIEATKELKAVQKHHENWRKEQAVESARRNSAAMDEVAVRLWAENKR